MKSNKNSKINKIITLSKLTKIASTILALSIVTAPQFLQPIATVQAQPQVKYQNKQAQVVKTYTKEYKILSIHYSPSEKISYIAYQNIKNKNDKYTLDSAVTEKQIQQYMKNHSKDRYLISFRIDTNDIYSFRQVR